MKKTAILSDIHANIVALEAVLSDIAKRDDIERIICLGDNIGYGPRPKEVLDIVIDHFSSSLMGNHEWACINGPQNFNSMAAEAILWTSEQVKDKKYTDFIESLSPAALEGKFLFVHGSVRDPLMDYVREANSPEKFHSLVETLQRDFKQFDCCFVGHNHKPFLGTGDGYIFPHKLMNRFKVDEGKLYVSVGSVGQPRDKNPQSCYTIFDGEFVEFVRVKYDVQKAIELFTDTNLHSFLAHRLISGE